MTQFATLFCHFEKRHRIDPVKEAVRILSNLVVTIGGVKHCTKCEFILRYKQANSNDILTTHLVHIRRKKTLPLTDYATLRLQKHDIIDRHVGDWTVSECTILVTHNVSFVDIVVFRYESILLEILRLSIC